jgi:hypothetical protein
MAGAVSRPTGSTTTRASASPVGGLVGGEEPERVAGHHQGRGETFGREPRQRHLIEARSQKGRELLGIGLAR